MPKVKDRHVVLRRAGYTIGGFVSLSIGLALITGCNEDGRNGIPAELFEEPHFHRTLTIFFDGVPLREVDIVEEESVDPNAENVRERPKVVWYVHETEKQCAHCHGNRQQKTFSREVQLTAQAPDLCYGCHDPFVPTALDDWVHGPVAAGECLFCHEPHRTRNKHLLRRPIPELCYGCHEQAVVGLILGHSDESLSACNDCHGAHIGSREYFLKPDRQENAVDNKEPESIAEPPAQ